MMFKNDGCGGTTVGSHFRLTFFVLSPKEANDVQKTILNTLRVSGSLESSLGVPKK
jgi:hypothetical protein